VKVYVSPRVIRLEIVFDLAVNTVGLVVVSMLACAPAFEAYRFLTFFFRERRTRRAFRHFN
jgi:hypothetical protein